MPSEFSFNGEIRSFILHKTTSLFMHTHPLRQSYIVLCTFHYYLFSLRFRKIILLFIFSLLPTKLFSKQFLHQPSIYTTFAFSHMSKFLYVHVCMKIYTGMNAFFFYSIIVCFYSGYYPKH